MSKLLALMAENQKLQVERDLYRRALFFIAEYSQNNWVPGGTRPSKSEQILVGVAKKVIEEGRKLERDNQRTAR